MEEVVKGMEEQVERTKGKEGGEVEGAEEEERLRRRGPRSDHVHHVFEIANKTGG